MKANGRSFLVDHMLMRLARWLRLVGQDVSNPPPQAQDPDLIFLAKKEGRTLLTRDKALASRCQKAGADCILILSSDLESQLREMKVLGVSMELNPVRCTVCNGNLREVEDPDLRKKYAHLKGSALWRCRSCGKLYWEGSHWKRIEETLERIR